MQQRFHSQKRVEFRDTDAAGLAHFSAYLVWMEVVEHEFLRHLGLSVHAAQDRHYLTWPRVSAHCDYIAPARFEDLLEIWLGVRHVGTKSVQYESEFWCADRAVARGYLVAACCHLVPNRPPQAVAIPDHIRQLLAPYQLPDRSPA